MGTCYVCGQQLVQVVIKELGRNPQICGSCAGDRPEGVAADVRLLGGESHGLSQAGDTAPPRVVPEGHHMGGGPS